MFFLRAEYLNKSIIENLFCSFSFASFSKSKSYEDSSYYVLFILAILFKDFKAAYLFFKYKYLGDSIYLFLIFMQNILRSHLLINIHLLYIQ